MFDIIKRLLRPKIHFVFSCQAQIRKLFTTEDRTQYQYIEQKQILSNKEDRQTSGLIQLPIIMITLKFEITQHTYYYIRIEHITLKFAKNEKSSAFVNVF